MKLIVGLGNPGKNYSANRHNIGFMTIDHLLRQNNLLLDKNNFQAVYGRGTVCGVQVFIVKPLTYMNLSGEAVGSISHYFDIDPGDIIVVHDDMDIAFGNIKVKTSGGSAGQRGIASIIECLGVDHFIRIRMGIGSPPPNIPPADFVLQNFNPIEQQQLKEVISRTTACIETILQQGPQVAMNKFHSLGPA